MIRTFPALALAAAVLAAATASHAAAPRDAASLVQEAIRYEHAEGVPRDLARARALYCEAAQAGDATAAFAIGWMYFNGRGVERDDGNAAAWFRLAAERGHAHAPAALQRLSGTPNAKPIGCSAPRPPVGTINVVPPAQIAAMVNTMAPTYRLDPKLVLTVIAAESGFQTGAVSPKNAQGLMQLIPETAERFGVRDAFDPAQNLRGGMKYLRFLLDRFDGDLSRALAGYNAGEGAVERHGGVPPYQETEAYVAKIRQTYEPPRPESKPIAPRSF